MGFSIVFGATVVGVHDRSLAMHWGLSGRGRCCWLHGWEFGKKESNKQWRHPQKNGLGWN